MQRNPIVLSLALTGLILAACGGRGRPAGEPRGEIEFDGDRIVFHAPAERFLSMTYEDRARMLVRQADSVAAYVRSRTGDTDLTVILARIKPAGPRTLEILPAADAQAIRSFKANAHFSTHLSAHERQEDTFKFFSDLIKTYDPEFPAHRLDLKKMYGFSEERLRQMSASDAVVRYVERAMIYRDIAEAQRGEAARGSDAHVEALLDWSFVNVSNHFKRVNPPSGHFFDYNDIPLELMLRGMGSCDRSVWSLVTLAYYGGLEAHVVYLYREDRQVSFHTVAEIKTEAGWKVVDPYNNRVYAEGALSLSGHDPDFKDCGIFLNPVEAHAMLPGMALRELISRFYVPDQCLFFDVDLAMTRFVSSNLVPRHNTGKVRQVAWELLSGIAREDPGLNPKVQARTARVGRWDFPFWMRGYYDQDLFQVIKDKSMPFLKTLREARLRQVLGRYDDAEKIFRELEKVPEDHTGLFQEERDYFRVLNSFYKKDDAEVERRAAEYRVRHPLSLRLSMLNYLLAHSLERGRRHAEAVNVYPAGANFEGRGKLAN